MLLVCGRPPIGTAAHDSALATSTFTLSSTAEPATSVATSTAA